LSSGLLDGVSASHHPIRVGPPLPPAERRAHPIHHRRQHETASARPSKLDPFTLLIDEHSSSEALR
jgi:hypothetical protein